jgi:hypothetical protein
VLYSLETRLGLVDDDLADGTVAVLLEELDYATAAKRVQTFRYGGGVNQIPLAQITGQVRVYLDELNLFVLLR